MPRIGMRPRPARSDKGSVYGRSSVSFRGGDATGAWLVGDPAAALALLEEVRDEAAGGGDGQRLVFVERRSGESLESEGRYEEAVVAWRTALAETARSGERWNRSRFMATLR